MPNTKDDERRLAELGYKQELNRSWSSFSNFAISFSIISILAGCFTTFAQGWNNGGPIAISIGWPLISAFILIIGLCMSELASAYPTSGGIYWWASKLGGAKAGFYTGWLNLIGLLAVTASVGYGAASFLNVLIGSISSDYGTSFMGGDYLKQQFFWFAVLMIFVTVINIFGGHLLAIINNVSVWWHVFGAAIVVGILIFIPENHQSLKWMYTTQINNSGFSDNSYWFYVLPLGFLLTQYTITGFDASAHLSEETHGAHMAAARGIWQSIFYSAVGGYILLMAFLYAATNTDYINSFDPAVNPYGGGSIIALLFTALGNGAAFKLVMIITTSGQIFCVAACLTSCSRMMYAFSRDGAVPGGRLWKKVNKHRVPLNAVLVSALIGVIITLPALYKSPTGAPTAFYAVVSVAVIGLYLAFLIPIYLRWKMGDKFVGGQWTLGNKYKWMNLVAVAEIAIISVYFILPFTPTGVPGNKDFTWTAVNYAPILTFGVLIILWIWWHMSVKNWFKGPIRTIDQA
ncbi:MAG TPA: amino acid permease [Candidatus Paceibacterota bacterium]|nr:amino acid permease [Candidatus Paceibacterota bacterium]